MQFQLLHGLWRTGQNHRALSMRPMTGRDEVFLLELPLSWPAAGRTSALLERIVQGVDGVEGSPPEIVRELTAGDRERLLISLCRKYLGDRVDLVARCHEPSCGQLTEVTLSLASLFSTETQTQPQQSYSVDCVFDRRRLRVDFKLPTGRMEEQIAQTALSNPSAAADELFDLVVLKIAVEDGQPVDRTAAMDTVRAALETAIQELEPALDRHSRISCEACGDPLTVEFDGLSVLTDAVNRDGDIFRQVDLLAKVYHWRETDILDLPPTRRRRYLRLAQEPGRAVA